MRELLELLKNTDTYMTVWPDPLGIKVQFLHYNNGEPKHYALIISDGELGTLEISLDEYILHKLEWFLGELGIKTVA